MTQIGIQ